MMAAISNTAMLDSDTLLSTVRFTEKHSNCTLTLTQTNSIWLICWWQPSWILPSWIQPFWKKNFSHSFWLNLMMAAILNSAILDTDTAILDSNTLLSSLRFTQKHSHSTPTLTQTNSIWLKLILSHSTWWWQSSWNLPSWIQLFWRKKTTSLIHSDSTWRWQPSWNLPTWIQPICSKKLHSYILTHLDDGRHLEFYHLEFCHLGFNTFEQ